MVRALEVTETESTVHQQTNYQSIAVNLTLANRQVKARQGWRLFMAGPRAGLAWLALFLLVCVPVSAEGIDRDESAAAGGAIRQLTLRKSNRLRKLCKSHLSYSCVSAGKWFLYNRDAVPAYALSHLSCLHAHEGVTPGLLCVS